MAATPLIVPLGLRCFTALLLQAFGHRAAAYPFDWAVAFLPAIRKAFEANFANMLTPDVLADPRTPNPYGLEFIHTYDCGETAEEAVVKMERRVQRLRDVCTGHRPVRFLTVYHATATRYFDLAELKALDATIHRLYPQLPYEFIVLHHHDQLRAAVPLSPRLRLILGRFRLTDARFDTAEAFANDNDFTRWLR